MGRTIYSTYEKSYEFYEKQSRSQYNRRCIDNTITGCNKCVGFCQYSGHPGFLTEKHRKQHDCIGKRCYYYIAKPEKIKPAKTLFDLSATILTLLREMMNENDGIRVIRVENTGLSRYKAFYVTITNECGFDRYSTTIEQKLGIAIEFIKLNYNFDKCAALLFAS